MAPASRWELTFCWFSAQIFARVPDPQERTPQPVRMADDLGSYMCTFTLSRVKIQSAPSSPGNPDYSPCVTEGEMEAHVLDVTCPTSQSPGLAAEARDSHPHPARQVPVLKSSCWGPHGSSPTPDFLAVCFRSETRTAPCSPCIWARSGSWCCAATRR